MRKFPILTLFILLFARTASLANEYWKNYSFGNVPWTDAKAIVSYKGQLLVSGKTAIANNWGHDNLWKMNMDTTPPTWSVVTIPPPLSTYNRAIHSFCEHNGSLYGFEVEIATVSGSQYIATRRVLKSNDGVTWQQTDQGVFSTAFGSFSDSVSFGGYIYVGDFNGNIWRSNGVGQLTTWTSVNIPFSGGINQNKIVSFARYKNFLLAACQTNDPIFPNTVIYSSSDGVQWSFFISPAIGEQMRPGTTIKEDSLYWAGNHLLRTEGNPPNGGPWTPINAGVLPVPFLINDQIHVFGPTSQVLAYQSDTSWASTELDQIGSCVTNAPKYPHGATVNNITFFLPCDLIGIQNGIDSISGTVLPTPTLRPNDRAIPVIGFELKVNFKDIISRLEFRNLESTPAENQIDIESLILYKSNDVLEKVAELIFDTNRNLWRLPNNLEIPITDLDSFQVMANIASTARDGRAIRLQIANNGIQTRARPTFTSEIIESPISQTINSPAPAAPLNIKGVEVGPNPGKDIVYFFYTLDTTSSVEIKLFDRAGRQIEELTETSKPAGTRVNTEWNASQVAPGLYFARIRIKSPAGERIHKAQIVIER